MRVLEFLGLGTTRLSLEEFRFRLKRGEGWPKVPEMCRGLHVGCPEPELQALNPKQKNKP